MPRIMRLSFADLATAAAPALGGAALSTINEVAGLAATVLGIAYLLWRWRREAKTPPGE